MLPKTQKSTFCEVLMGSIVVPSSRRPIDRMVSASAGSMPSKAVPLKVMADNRAAAQTPLNRFLLMVPLLFELYESKVQSVVVGHRCIGDRVEMTGDMSRVI